MSMELYKALTEKNKDDFIMVINKLLFKNFIVERTYERGKSEANPDYRFLSYNRALCEEYLHMIGWELIDDELNGVYSIKNKYFTNPLSLNRTTSIILLILRLIYEEKLSKSSYSRDVTAKVSEVLAKLDAFKLFEKNPNASELDNAFRTLHKYQILEKIQGSYSDPDSIIVIYPSIIYAVSNENLMYILKRYETKNERKKKVENSSEVIEIYSDGYDGEEFADENS